MQGVDRAIGRQQAHQHIAVLRLPLRDYPLEVAGVIGFQRPPQVV
jgi:hypothetical protein